MPQKLWLKGRWRRPKNSPCKITLIGKEQDIRQELKKCGGGIDSVEIINAPEVIGMGEPAALSIRKNAIPPL